MISYYSKQTTLSTYLFKLKNLFRDISSMQRLLQLGVTLLCVANQSLLLLFSSWPLPTKQFWQYTLLTQQPVEQ